jgi:parvulin-like peptidyl-prolyl isomerase
MSLRVRRQKVSIRSRLGRLVETEERQNFLVSALFVTAIVVTLLILVGAIALAWYNDNLRPLARVGSVEVGPQLLRDRLNLEQWRINRERDRITQAVIDGEIDSATAQSLNTALDQQLQGLGATGLDDLVDIIFQSQLAAQEGIGVAASDIDARLADELAGVEQRHVLAITVEPQAADEEAGPTFDERRAALARAEEALAEVNSGRAWGDVAPEFSTDDDVANGGDLGLVTPASVGDQVFASALFDLEQGATTNVVRGSDGAYRIGRVTEIVTAAEVPGLRDRLLANVADPNVRQILGYEIAADRLQDKIVADALSETPEQVRLAVIYIEGFSSGDPEDEGGEVDYSEIVFAPGDDLLTAPDLDPDDPGWAAAEADSKTVFDQLTAIDDVEERMARFETLATTLSDSPTAEDAGRVGFVTPEIPPSAVADALFEGEHTEGELIGPVRGDAAWYVLLFHEHRASPEQRLQAVRDALAAPGADFNEVARELSEGPEAEDGGEIGWLTRDQLDEELADDVFGLEVGEVSEPLELGDGHFFIKVEEKGVRRYDADQIPSIRVSAFENWYADKRDEAEANGTIVIAGEEDVTDGDLEPGFDEP